MLRPIVSRPMLGFKLFILLFLGMLCASLFDDMVDFQTEEMPSFCQRKSELGDSIYISFSCNYIHGGQERETVISNVDFVLGHGKFDELLEQGLVHMCINEIRTVHIKGGLESKSAVRKHNNIPRQAAMHCKVKCTDVTDRHYRNPAQLHNTFQKMDIDGDSQLTRHEFEQFYRTYHNMEHLASNMFDIEDKDNDTVISFDEFQGPKGLNGDNHAMYANGNHLQPVPHSITVNEDTFRKARRNVDAHGKYHRHRGGKGPEL